MLSGLSGGIGSSLVQHLHEEMSAGLNEARISKVSLNAFIIYFL